MSMRKELLKGLTKEQIAKVKACKSQEELLAVAKEEGVELTDEQLAAVNGGCFTEPPAPPCPHCGSHNTKNNASYDDGMGYGSGSDYPYYCKDCRQYFGSRK